MKKYFYFLEKRAQDTKFNKYKENFGTAYDSVKLGSFNVLLCKRMFLQLLKGSKWN